MTVELATLISVVSILIAVATFFINRKKDTTAEVKEEATVLSGIKESLLKANMKLDSVCATTNETRSDIKSMTNKIYELDKELGVVKTDIHTAFMRIDELKNKLEAMNNE